MAPVIRVVALVVLVSAVVQCACARPVRGGAQFMRAQPGGGAVRTQRGFKNASLSVARGFGKRNYDAAAADILAAASDRSAASGERANSFPVSWLVEELQNNPELARLLVEKFVDENGDGELTAEELLSRSY